ncbi:hypothetical protein H9Q10_11660 [Eikenella sp. S3360]|uniref:DUF309 domain-containing protein n=1 Tax=Eikenella glucosivorans TaxID=2766967 RepID=A0ABS0NDG7_9NEIS|nr:hypothetical protein [Eikenella glucosivorans]MBH5330319.1 hypothetical protein [Eikenella glucosivorans]
MSKNKRKTQFAPTQANPLDTLCRRPPDLPALQAYLAELKAQAQHISGSSNDYPARSINAAVWIDGYQLVHTARALANWLEQQRLYDLWPQALECWRLAAFAVVSHYRAEIGPLMHAMMRLQKRRGNTQSVQEMCRAILADFSIILEDAEALLTDGRTEPTDYQEDSELAAIAYLDLAARHLAAHGDSQAQAIRQRLKQLPPYWQSLKL